MMGHDADDLISGLSTPTAAREHFLCKPNKVFCTIGWRIPTIILATQRFVNPASASASTWASPCLLDSDTIFLLSFFSFCSCHDSHDWSKYVDERASCFSAPLGTSLTNYFEGIVLSQRRGWYTLFFHSRSIPLVASTLVNNDKHCKLLYPKTKTSLAQLSSWH
jgi:hypothetical protein